MEKCFGCLDELATTNIGSTLLAGYLVQRVKGQRNADRIAGLRPEVVLVGEFANVGRSPAPLGEEDIERRQYGGFAGPIWADKTGVRIQNNCLVLKASEILDANRLDLHRADSRRIV